MKLPSLTNKAIRAYVEALPPDEPVGRCKDPQRCLIARYIEAAIGPRRTARRYITVSVYHIDVYEWDDNWETKTELRRRPSAALQDLIQRFDALPMPMPLPADVLPIFDKEART